MESDSLSICHRNRESSTSYDCLLYGLRDLLLLRPKNDKSAQLDTTLAFCNRYRGYLRVMCRSWSDGFTCETRWKDSINDEARRSIYHDCMARKQPLFLICFDHAQAGLKSFCLIFCACFKKLYLCLLTFFLSALVWDTRRVACRTNDCCNICAHCQEDTFFKGDCLSAKQREFSGLPKNPTNSNQFQKDRTSF